MWPILGERCLDSVQCKVERSTKMSGNATPRPSGRDYDLADPVDSFIEVVRRVGGVIFLLVVLAAVIAGAAVLSQLA
jgi:hypothetical protein